MSVWVFGRGLLPVTRRPIDTNALITNIVYGWMVWLVVLSLPPTCVCAFATLMASITLSPRLGYVFRSFGVTRPYRIAYGRIRIDIRMNCDKPSAY